MKFLLYSLLAALYLCTASCTGTDDVTCTDGSLVLIAKGFTTGDFQNAVLVRYQPDNLFDKPVDTNTISYTFREGSATATDTADISVRFPQDANANPNIPITYDYMVIFPAISKTVTISNIKLLGHTSQSFKRGLFNDKAYVCYNPVASYSYNGSSVTVSGYNTATIYLTK